MLPAMEAVVRNDSEENIAARFTRIRGLSLALCASLATEDYVVQSMPDASPTKWHLAHISWFFEKFVLEPYASGYRNFDDRFHYLFNSYYYSAGDMHRRPERGLLSRPTLDTVIRYRTHIDNAVLALLDKDTVAPELEQISENGDPQNEQTKCGEDRTDLDPIEGRWGHRTRPVARQLFRVGAGHAQVLHTGGMPLTDDRRSPA